MQYIGNRKLFAQTYLDFCFANTLLQWIFLGRPTVVRFHFISSKQRKNIFLLKRW